MKLPKTALTLLWLATGVIIVALTVATIQTAIRAIEGAEVGTTAYLVSRTQLVHLHAKPSAYSETIAILEQDLPVEILRTEKEGGRRWYYIRLDETEGWVDAVRISFTPP
ncbi:MAG: hypothetical protein GTO18_09795 [Anaerolineales bacterium]|nr:hypothetical protein [Anaerolineales bacterium]